MLEFLEGAVDVVVYGNIDVAFGVVPFQVESIVKGADPVECAFVVGLYRMDKMICVVLGEVLHAKFVNAKGNVCFAGYVFPEAWVYFIG